MSYLPMSTRPQVGVRVDLALADLCMDESEAIPVHAAVLCPLNVAPRSQSHSLLLQHLLQGRDEEAGRNRPLPKKDAQVLRPATL